MSPPLIHCNFTAMVAPKNCRQYLRA